MTCCFLCSSEDFNIWLQSQSKWVHLIWQIDNLTQQSTLAYEYITRNRVDKLMVLGLPKTLLSLLSCKSLWLMLSINGDPMLVFSFCSKLGTISSSFHFFFSSREIFKYFKYMVLFSCIRLRIVWKHCILNKFSLSYTWP